jgi:hypothetical protein
MGLSQTELVVPPPAHSRSPAQPWGPKPQPISPVLARLAQPNKQTQRPGRRGEEQQPRVCHI